MTVNKNKVMTFNDTVSLIKRVHLASANPIAVSPHYDGTKGEYDNLDEWWSLNRDGKIYGVKIPEFTYSNSPNGIKTRDNAGLTIEPSTNTVVGRDDYANLNAFRSIDVNATIDDNGVAHVTAIDGDGRFARDGSAGDVWVMVCNGYYSITHDNGYKIILYSDTQFEGMRTMPGGLYPDGKRRGFLLFAKYAAWLDSSNVPHSYSGKTVSYTFGSQDNNIAFTRKKGSGYSGRTIADNFYLQLMFMLKYATQDSQSVGGCGEYEAGYPIAKAETNANRVVVAKEKGDYFIVGSCVNVGISTNRSSKDCSSIASLRIVTKIEPISDALTAVYLNGAPITTTEQSFITTMPWISGSCDNILGIDGYPVSAKPKQRQPYSIQGIEFMLGAYEVLADVICNQIKDSETAGHVELYKCFDARKYASSLTSDYVKCDLELPKVGADADNKWVYTKDWRESANIAGWLIPTESGATSTTGLCDGVYSTPITNEGLRELLCFGNFLEGAPCGVWCAFSDGGLSGYWLNFGGRLSGLGITKAS